MYLLFAGERFTALGGLLDLLGIFDTEDAARDYFEGWRERDTWHYWAHICLVGSREVVVVDEFMPCVLEEVYVDDLKTHMYGYAWATAKHADPEIVRVKAKLLEIPENSVE